MAASRRRPSLHRVLVAAEAVLLLGVAKDWVWRQVRAFDIADWGKVALAMLATVGLFGGMLVAVQSLLVKGVAKTHQTARWFSLPTLVLHAALMFVLFLLYARMLGVQPFS